jgi:hypothetical protein
MVFQKFPLQKENRAPKRGSGDLTFTVHLFRSERLQQDTNSAKNIMSAFGFPSMFDVQRSSFPGPPPPVPGFSMTCRMKFTSFL